MNHTKVIFALEDGSLAWDVKIFLMEQLDCQSLVTEQNIYWDEGATSQRRMLMTR